VNPIPDSEKEFCKTLFDYVYGAIKKAKLSPETETALLCVLMATAFVDHNIDLSETKYLVSEIEFSIKEQKKAQVK